MEKILSQKQILARVKEAYEKGFIIVPSKPNNEGVFKVPVWKGEIKEQIEKMDYDEFLKAIQGLDKFGFGFIVGKQKNGLYVNVLDFDVDGFNKSITDKLINALQEIAKEDENKLNALLSGIEYTQSGRLHYIFLTSEPVEAGTKRVFIGKKNGKNGVEDGFIELFTENNRFVALYEGVIKDTDKMPVILRDLVILTPEEVNILLRNLNFLKEKKEQKQANQGLNNTNFQSVDLGKLKNIILSGYKKGQRHFVCLYVAGLLKKLGINLDTTLKFIEEIAVEKEDEEIKDRLKAVKTTYERSDEENKGLKGLVELGYPEDELLSCLYERKSSFDGFIIPEGFTISGGLLYEEKGKKQKLLSPAFVVSEKLINENNNLTGFILKFEKEKIEISENSPEEIINGFKRLGFILDKDTARKLSHYITSFFVVNRDKIKSEKLISRTGWSEDFSEFYLPQTTEYIFDDLNGFGAKGDKQKELELMRLLFEKKSHIAFGYCLGFSSVLTHFVGSGNFSVFIQGFSGKGKTTIGAIGLSLFGDYQKLKNSLDRTDTGTEILLSKRLDVLNLLDEINTGRGDVVKELIKIIYNFEEGTGRVRAKKNLKLQEVKRFRGVLAFTSEMDFKTLMKKSERVVKGAFRRTFILDIDRYQKISEDLADNIYKVISENHGNLISDFIDYLKQNKSKVIKEYEKIKAELKEKGFYLKGLERYFSVVLLANDLIREIYGIDTTGIKEELYKQIRISAEISTGEIYINKEILRAKILDFFFENKKHFEYAELRKINRDETGQIYGEYEIKKAEQLWGGYEEDRETRKQKFYFTSKGLEELAEYIGITKNALIDYLLEYKMAIPNNNRKAGDTKIKRVKKSFSFSEYSSVNVYLIELETEPEDIPELTDLVKEEEKEIGLFKFTMEQTNTEEPEEVKILEVAEELLKNDGLPSMKYSEILEKKNLQRRIADNYFKFNGIKFVINDEIKILNLAEKYNKQEVIEAIINKLPL